jgi:acyl dehydratase
MRDFVRFLGGEPADWRGVVPPLLFPQWTFPLLAKTLAPLPIQAHRLLNGGFTLDVTAPLPADEALEVEAQLVAIEEGPRKTTFVQEVVTGTASSPQALRVRFFPVLPRRRATDAATPEEAGPEAAGAGPLGVHLPATPPEDARVVATFPLARRAGLDFAALTGDFNPIHWLPPVARLSGFRDVILHGFASFGMALTRLVALELGGDPQRVRQVAARFNRPLVLPATAQLLSDGAGGLWLGPGRGEKSWVSGQVTVG